MAVPEPANLQQDVITAFLQQNSALEGVVAVGTTLEEDGLIVVVTVRDRGEFAYPESFEARVDDELRRFQVRLEEGPPAFLLLSGQAHLPVPPRGKIHGGDAIWHPANGWGTIAFSCSEITLVNHQNAQRVIPNAVLGCNHILAMLDAAAANDQIATYRRSGDLWLDYFWPVTDAMVTPIDLAVGQADVLNDYAPLEVRGLGTITGVGTVTASERLFKCGARTSITTALDAGPEMLLVPQYANRYVLLRKTTRGFSDVGDSGAAVLNGDRELVGIVVAGRLTVSGLITYYLQTVPIGTSTGQELSVQLQIA